MQVEPKLLSLAVPVYNGEKYLPDCLESLKIAIEALPAEDRARIEIVLCDNRSTDKSLELLQAHRIPCDVNIVQPPEHFSNRTRNWNYALHQGTGVWIVMLHADDRMAPGGFGAMLCAIRQKAASKAVVIGGRHRVFEDGGLPGELLPRWRFPALIPGGLIRRYISPFLCVTMPFSLIKNDIFQKVGDFEEEYELVQDWDYWYRILGVGDYYYHPEQFCNWYSHPYNEKTMDRFALEHLLYLFRLSKMNLRGGSEISNFHISRVRLWYPEKNPVEFVRNREEEVFVQSIPVVDSDSAKKNIKKSMFKINISYVLLRVFGYLRLCFLR